MQLGAGSLPTPWTITMTASDLHGCTDVETAVVTVWPEADFAFSVPEVAACSPLIWEGTPLAGASGTWNFGDGSSGTTPVHTWSNTTGELESYTVTFTGTTTFGCPGRTVSEQPQYRTNFPFGGSVVISVGVSSSFGGGFGRSGVMSLSVGASPVTSTAASSTLLEPETPTVRWPCRRSTSPARLPH